MTVFAEHPSNLSPDGELVWAYLEGDENAFETLYLRFYPQVVQLMTARVRDRALAEDLAQETMLRALRYLHGYDLTRPLWPWLYRIASNLATGEAARRGAEIPVDEVDGALLALPDHTDQIVTHDLVMACLDRLPKRQRNALILRYVEDRPITDIAAALDLNRNATQQLLSRGRNGLRSEFTARNVALTPVVTALTSRVRRAFAAATARLQQAGGTTFSMAGDAAIGAALTVGGITLATTLGGLGGADATPREVAAPRTYVSGSQAVRPASTTTAATVDGPLAAAPAAADAAKAAEGTAPETAAGDTAGWQDGSGTEPEAGGDPVVTGDGDAGQGDGGQDSSALGESTAGADTAPGWTDPGGPPEEEVLVHVGDGGTAPEAEVAVTDKGTSGTVSTPENKTAEGSGEVALNRRIYKEGEVIEQEVDSTVAEYPIEWELDVYNTGDGDAACAYTGTCL